MADPLSVLGGISAGGHLVVAIIKTIRDISDIYENFKMHPATSFESRMDSPQSKRS
jgi:acetyl esterase/lipase